MTTVGNHIKRVKAYENAFARHYGLQINHKQSKGSAYDCIIPSTGERIEFKADLMGAKTGNHFVEFRYSRDEGKTWDQSGITLAKDQSQYWVVYFGDEPGVYSWFRPLDVLALVEQTNAQIKGIRRNLYGNSGSVRCEGFIVPIKDLKLIEIKSPIEPAELEESEDW